MITSTIIHGAYYVLSILLAWLSNVEFLQSSGFPDAAHSAARAIGGAWAMWDLLIPVTSFMLAVTFVMSVEIGIFAFKTAKWIISHIPFIGGKGV